jgi:hypothetical protein
MNQTIVYSRGSTNPLVHSSVVREKLRLMSEKT